MMPKIAEPALDTKSLRPVHAGELAAFMEQTDEREVTETALESLQLSGAALVYRDWKQCLFDHCRLGGAKTKGSYFSDVVFRDCDLSNGDLSDCVFSRVRFVNCRLTGANLSSCGFHDVQFIDSVADYSVFSLSKAKTVWFTRCNLTDASLNELAGKSYGFTDCDLARVDFRGTQLAGVNLTSCEIGGVSLSPQELRGCVVSSFQAVELARMLGVVVED